MLELRKPEPRERVIAGELARENDETGFERIRCPLCEWRPSPSSTWCCYAEATPEPPFPWCGTQWNTFSTHGCCPGCRHQWRWTSCVRCAGWSLHDDWYESE